MLILVILAIIIVIYTIINSIYKRFKTMKKLSNSFNLNIKTLISYSSFIYSIFIALLVAYLLYDNISKQLDIYSVVIVLLIVLLGFYKILTQYLFKPVFYNEGILFYNGIFLQWDNLSELKVQKRTKNGETIVLLGGKTGFSSLAREQIVISNESLKQFEILINTRTNIKN